MAGPQVGDLLLDRAGLVGLALLELGVDLLGVVADDLAQPRGGLLAALVAGGDDDLARRGEGDGLLGDAGLELGQRGLGLLGGRGDLLGPRGALRLEVARLVRPSSAFSSSSGRFRSARSSSSSSARRSPALPPRPSASSSIAARARLRASSSTWVTMYSAKYRIRSRLRGLMSSRMPEPARRALEVPDVADRAGQLDVAHPLATDLRAGDLDAALVADDALVADPLVLAAVALPVLGRTEDALVEEAVLLRLERPVVDGLGLRDLALRPLPDLVRAGERDADRVEVIDFEHGSPPRRRLARRRDADRERAEPRRPGRGPAGTVSGWGRVQCA